MGASHRTHRTRRTRRGTARIAAAVAVLLAAGAVALTLTRSDRRAPRPPAHAAAAPTNPTPDTHRPAQPTHPPPPPVTASWYAPPPAGLPGHLRGGSDPAALPGPILIADKLNNRLLVIDPHGRIRWQFPRPGDLAPGQPFQRPDDAFFTPDGRQIVATQEDRAVISVIDIATHRIVYRYGQPGHPGPGPNQLNNPDDALMLPNHDLLTADIQNCRILLIAPGAHQPARVLGRTTTACLHAPPARWGSPNGVFPMPGRHYLVTEINGDWVDDITLTGTVSWSTHPPGVTYPSDTNQIAPDRYLTADYSSPGQLVIFDRAGQRIWHYTGTGRDTLDHPSLALPLPNGDIAANDDYNHRVIVLDPRTDRIVWQYGTTGVPGDRPGYLNNPDGIDLAPPHSLLTTHAPGTWP